MDLARADVLDRLERFYDAVPRDGARTEEYGALVLFVREGAGWPFYARPRLDATEHPTLADVNAVRTRQQELGLPEAFEWVHEHQPELLAVARSAGLSVLEAPLMLLEPERLPEPGTFSDVPVRVLDPGDAGFAADIALRRAVAAVGFANGGTARGEAGPAERDATVSGLDVAALEEEATRVADGRRISVLAATPEEGALAGGMAMRVGDVAEIAGVATLPSARRRGLGAAVTATLARELRAAGTDLIFLSAGSEDIARVYLRVGFRRIGTACIAEPAAVI
ncbi:MULTISPECIES: GNAT family N-acetyltransferase [Micromonospora]|uniref:GNAT family N-acetyltransferase n=1 Tax=Micromonospora TaxID=1873 RepID=UPI0003EEB4BF|nr:MULTISPECIES: GNAT family N-acetyltransferase [Micromonospora]EWM68579.1 LigA protein [Micromonospora sp. M42]MBP1784603.1 ribosomal protein S18 acetylase RimI-like enzyme [Micromonospora sp. HB375]MCK1806314.1 GNAT family N-acetyltransferase [Micromonospora sp. R42106]MCK1831067.1 GNAT family N-acetyltransferase [Micromonospora sp. R42003]MCK1842553.1 GNAT family N-acetyltransferase [Micromonospora sp. R42004]